MRKAFADTLIGLASEDPRVIFLTGDLGFGVFDEFSDRFGPRYVNVGVAEAAMVCAAAGLALEGWRPVAYSIASFATARAFEQIRISLAYHQLPVVIVGAGGGYNYAASGVTHHAADDLGLMSLLPGMTVVAPGDPSEVTQLLPQVFQQPGPAYFRIGRYGEPTYPAEEPAVLGRARLLTQGERVGILSTGDSALAVSDAVQALRKEGISPIAYQMHTVKPLDIATLERLAKQVETIVTVEEHVPLGGLGDAVGSWLTGLDEGPKLVRLGPPDGLVLGNPRQEELRRRLNYDARGIADACRSAWIKS